MGRFLPFVLLITLLGWGCSSPASGDDDDTHDGSGNGHGDDDDDDADDDAGDDDSQQGPETDCTDGDDNDHDGLVDCADSDCDAELACTWPNEMDLQSRFEFISDVGFLDDCEVRFESLLVRKDSGNVCPSCDRTYEGQYQYSVNTCEEFFELGDIDLPDQGMFGLNFISLYERDVYTLNTETTTWDLVGTAAYNDQLGHYMLQRQDPVDVYGTLHTEMTFSDR